MNDNNPVTTIPPAPTVKQHPIRNSIGAAIAYFLAFIAPQAVVSVICIVIFSGIATVELAGAAMIDPDVIMVRVEELMMEHSMITTVVSQILSLVTLFLVIKLRKRPVLKATFCNPISPLRCVFALLVGVCMVFTIQLAFTVLPLPESLVESYVEQVGTTGNAPLALTLLATVLLAPLTEELIMRGLVYTRLRRLMPVWLAVLISASVFGILHGHLLWFAYTLVLGVVLALLFEATRSLYIPICIHIGFNALGAFFPMLFGETVETIEMILIAVLGTVGLAASILVLLWKCKPAAESTIAPTNLP